MFCVVHSSGENNAGSLSSYKGGLVRGAQLLNERFLSMWAKDNYQDYLKNSTLVEHEQNFITGSSHAVSNNNNRSSNGGSTLLESMVNSSDETDRNSDDEEDEEEDDKRQQQQQRQVIVDIHDDDDLGDDRIRPILLRKLLQTNLNLANLLYDCAEEEGLLHDENDNILDNFNNDDNNYDQGPNVESEPDYNND